MATATLLSAVTTDTTGEGSALSGPCTVDVTGGLDGGHVSIDWSLDDVDYFDIEDPMINYTPKSWNVVRYGAYYLRARLYGSGGAAEVTVLATQ
jgi:hypothetical protein